MATEFAASSRTLGDRYGLRARGEIDAIEVFGVSGRSNVNGMIIRFDIDIDNLQMCAGAPLTSQKRTAQSKRRDPGDRER